MDTSSFDDLPRAYRLGLSLRALGANDQLIAECVGVDVDSVGALLDIGARKLEHVRDVARLRNIGPEGSESSSAKGASNNYPNNKGQRND
jgi:hypothetical protein